MGNITGKNMLETDHKEAQLALSKSEIAKHFLFEPGYTNLNHGSFGTIPRMVRDKLREFQDATEAKPDQFIRYDYPRLLDAAREAVAPLLNVDVNTIVFVPNATTGANTILRNLVWNPDGKDEIVYFSVIYGSFEKTVKYVCETSHGLAHGRRIQLQLPMEDDEIVDLFRSTLLEATEQGRRPRLAIFDTISAMPGLRMPFDQLLAVCKQHGVMSFLDGAHGAGHIPLDLSASDPDFFVSNLHKWLFVPRGCAVFYVPFRNQALIRSTLPTGHSFVPEGEEAGDRGPFPRSSKSHFVSSFEFVGTIDSSPYLCVPEAIRFRNEVCGGEEKIMKHNITLAKTGGKVVAEILGTTVLDNKAGTMSNCCVSTILLPLTTVPHVSEIANIVKREEMPEASRWLIETAMKQYRTFFAIVWLQNQLWVRLSAQVYLDMSDFEWAGRTLKELCERIGRGEFRSHGAELEEVLAGGDLAKDGTKAMV